MINPSAGLRKWLALLMAILVYYVVHEGAHCLAAAAYGAFVEVRWLGVGVQVVVNKELLSDWQLAVFCLVGSLATLACGYLLIGLAQRICRVSSRLLKAVGYYCTVVLLLVDPIYLSFLYKCFGGGDMNGIRLLGWPEPAVQLVYLLVGLGNLLLVYRFVYPKYRQACQSR